ncbi:permease [Oceanirhabdus sp. W0125-5]|uniref:permease n=1 Tax=Oceanirhabdus sp. W0125-5 TaxID=2999116 RepID=UPI0022F2CDCA|nr:permease [Oceanirhabdus sp. W0125-5]WBW97322.1 permease [Oceanirhabdus sp. W0125-5]
MINIGNKNNIIKKNKILFIAILSYFILFIYNIELGISALSQSKYFFIEMIQIMPPIFILISLIQTWVPTKVIMNNFGDGAGAKGKLLSFAIGSLSAGPIYAAFPVCKILLNKGASVENIIIILSSWAVVKVPMLINEAKFMGIKYMIIRWICTIIAILLMAKIMKFWIKKEDIKTSSIECTVPMINAMSCVGCGNCARKYPKLYSMKEGKVVINIENIDKDILYKEIEKSKDCCPVNAIK